MGRLSIEIEDSPSKVNKLLSETSGISLFKFAQLFAACAADWHTLPPKSISTKAKLLKQQRVLIALKTSIIKTILEYEEAGTFPSMIDRNMPEAEIINKCWLRPFFNNYLNPGLETTTELLKKYRPQRGRPPINRKSLLAATWGRLIFQSAHKLGWRMVADLYEWFWEKLKDYDFYKEIRATEDPVSYFPVQYHRHKNRDLSIYYGRYARYDDITVFAKNGASVDYRFSYMFFKLYDARKKKLSPPVSYDEYRKLARGEFPVWEQGESEIDHCYHRILDYYLGLKEGSGDNIPPLIMFPDNTIFCSHPLESRSKTKKSQSTIVPQ